MRRSVSPPSESPLGDSSDHSSDHAPGDGWGRRPAPNPNPPPLSTPSVNGHAHDPDDGPARGEAAGNGDVSGDGWPALHADALYGLAGDIVKAIAPETEADPAGVLLTLLTHVGNIIGRGGHLRRGDDPPPRQLVLVLGRRHRQRQGDRRERRGVCRSEGGFRVGGELYRTRPVVRRRVDRAGEGRRHDRPVHDRRDETATRPRNRVRPAR